MVLFLLYDIKNARMQEKKVVWHGHFFRYSDPLVRHLQSGIRVQSGTAGHGPLVRHWPAYVTLTSVSIFPVCCCSRYLSLDETTGFKQTSPVNFLYKEFIRSDVLYT
jgi:hypothetical protein